MKPIDQMTTEQLVELFAEIALEQDEAMIADDNSKYSRLCPPIEAVEQELKSRNGDQRQALLSLYDHPNTHVRKTAAKATLALMPQAARRILQDIHESGEFIHAGDAGMTLWALDEGIFKPT
jgi:Domain of unknown function (DUF2019)